MNIPSLLSCHLNETHGIFLSSSVRAILKGGVTDGSKGGYQKGHSSF